MVRAMFWRAFLFIVAIGGAAMASELPASKPEARKEIVAAIEGQLAAFRRGDVRRAHALAAAALRAQKPLTEFRQIVEANYPEIWRSERAEYGIVRDDGARAAVTVRVYAKSGDASYDYTLQRENGAWRVLGVLRHEPKKGGAI